MPVLIVDPFGEGVAEGMERAATLIDEYVSVFMEMPRKEADYLVAGLAGASAAIRANINTPDREP